MADLMHVVNLIVFRYTVVPHALLVRQAEGTTAKEQVDSHCVHGKSLVHIRLINRTEL
jgi:hypothetical protein